MKLANFILNSKFPSTNIDLSISDETLSVDFRNKHGIIHTCSLCDEDILFNQALHVYSNVDERDGIINDIRVVGFICTECYDKICEYEGQYGE